MSLLIQTQLLREVGVQDSGGDPFQGDLMLREKGEKAPTGRQCSLPGFALIPLLTQGILKAGYPLIVRYSVHDVPPLRDASVGKYIEAVPHYTYCLSRRNLCGGIQLRVRWW